VQYTSAKVKEFVGLSVRLSLSHVELSLCSDIPFQKCRNHSSQNACCTNIFAQNFGRVDTARLADLFCPFLGTEIKKTTVQMFALFNIFSQEIWVQFLMALG
jgi:hypothetical protein